MLAIFLKKNKNRRIKHLFNIGFCIFTFLDKKRRKNCEDPCRYAFSFLLAMY